MISCHFTLFVITFPSFSFFIFCRLWWYQQCASREAMWYPCERHSSTCVHNVILTRRSTSHWQAAACRSKPRTKGLLPSCMWLAEESRASLTCIGQWSAYGWTRSILRIRCGFSELVFGAGRYLWCDQVPSLALGILIYTRTLFVQLLALFTEIFTRFFDGGILLQFIWLRWDIR